MSKFLDRYKTDKQAEESGQWVDFGDGIEVQVRRLNSKKSRDYRAKLEKPYATQYRGREMPDSLQREIMIKQIADVIIVDWKGVPNPADPESKNPFPYTSENARTVLVQFEDFMNDIVTASMTAATFQTEDRKQVEGNSENASNGSSDQSQI